MGLNVWLLFMALRVLRCCRDRRLACCCRPTHTCLRSTNSFSARLFRPLGFPSHVFGCLMRHDSRLDQEHVEMRSRTLTCACVSRRADPVLQSCPGVCCVRRLPCAMCASLRAVPCSMLLLWGPAGAHEVKALACRRWNLLRVKPNSVSEYRHSGET